MKINFTKFLLLFSFAFSATLTNAQCIISDLVATNGDCVNGQFYVTINFEYANVGNEGFKLQGNGNQYGNFEYADLPVTLGPFSGNGTTVYEFVAKDLQFPDCNDFDAVGPINCGTAPCDIFDFVVSPGDCNPDGTYTLSFDFQVENPPHTHFDLIYEGQNIGYYALADLPISLSNFEDNGEPGQVLKVCMNDSDCCAIDEFQAPDCPGSGDCLINEVVAEAHPCNADGQFMLDVAFSSQNTGNQGFKIRANNQFYGPFAYGQPFYTIGPLSGGVVYEIVVRDVEFELCKGIKLFGPVNCGGDCQIQELEASVSDCNEQGQFFVTIDFVPENTGGDGFKIFGNGNVYGFFGYDDLPVTIGPLTSSNDELEFGVADLNNPDCRDFVVVQVPDCDEPNSGDCQIFDLMADVHPCLPNGTFYVTLDFQHENTSGYFKLKGNGINFGVFSYDDLPIEIGPLLGNGSTAYEFVAIDIHHENCRDDVSIGTVACQDSGDCALHDLIIDPSGCNPDDSYNLWFWFGVENPGNNFYDVFHNGEHIGFYPLAQMPLTLPHVFANDEPLQTLTICINDNPDCCVSISYEAPNCEGLVWPGDANRDNICDNFDVLNLGIGYDAAGPHRPAQGLEWTGLVAESWPQVFADGVNFKHADCTGDGIVNAVDLLAISLNFGETNGEPQPVAYVEGNENSPPLFVDLPSANALQPGMNFTAPVMLGTIDAPLDDVYGIAFTIKFDPEIINPASIDLQYDPSWLGVQNVNLLSFDRTNLAAGEVKVALVRTDHNNVSGHGQIAALIGIIDNIAGKESVSIEITDVKAIRKNEALISLRNPVEIVDLTVNGAWERKAEIMEVYPNPAQSSINFKLPQGQKADLVELYSVDGRLQVSTNGVSNQLNINHLKDGVYILKVRSGQHVFQQKIVK